MEDELENLLHELAGQERERLRRKHSNQVEITTSQSRFRMNVDKSAYSHSRSFQHETFPCIKTFQNDKYFENKKTNKSDATRHTHSNKMTHSPFAAYLSDNSNLGHNYVTKRGSDSGSVTPNRSTGFQIVSRYSQDITPIRAHYHQDPFLHTNNDISFESKFAQHLQKIDDVLLNGNWNKFRYSKF